MMSDTQVNSCDSLTNLHSQGNSVALGARGGVHIAGGIAPRILGHLAASEFRSRFVQKGRFQAYLEAIPSQVIVHPAATFLGLMALSGTTGSYR
jgi:glucokinase